MRTDADGQLLARAWPEVHYILGRVFEKLSQQAILDRWPVEGERPDRSTLSRWLKRAARQGLVGCSGTGYRGNPLVYWLPGREPLLWPGDQASEEEKQAWREHYMTHERALHGGPASW